MDATTLASAALREFGADTPTTQTVMRVAVSLAAMVNKAAGLRGREKAELVISAIRQALANPEIKGRVSAEAHAALLATVDTVVPETLALVVAAGRGELDFRRPSVGCLAAIARALCRSAAAVAVVAPPREAAQVAAAIGIAEKATTALETAAATASEIVAELAPATDSTGAPTTPPSSEPAPTEPSGNPEAAQ
jgi:hypothetical protein